MNTGSLVHLMSKRKFKNWSFSEGIVIDTTYRIYLTSNLNSFFLAKSQFMKSSECKKEKLPIKNDEESSLVDKRFEISNLLQCIIETISLSAILQNDSLE